MRRLSLALMLFAPVAAAQSPVFGGALTSTRQAAASGAASFAPTNDPAAFSLNPALLPGTDGATLSVSRIPVPFADDALMATGTLRRTVRAGLPLRLGIGLSHTRSDQTYAGGDVSQGDVGAYRTDDSATAIGLGAETTGPVRIALGATLRRTTTGFTNDEIDHRDAVVSADVGLLGTVDVARLAGLGGRRFVPVVTVSAGYVQRNIGSTLDFVSLPRDESGIVTRPIARRAALGWSWKAGYDVRLRDERLPLFRAWSANETDASLVQTSFQITDDVFTYSYSPAFGHLRLADAISGQGRAFYRSCGDECETVSYAVGHSASTFEVGGTLSVTFGVERLAPDPQPLLRSNTWGLGLDVGGAMRAMGALRSDQRLQDLGDQIRLRLDYARLNYGQPGSKDAVTLTAGWAL